MPSVSTLPDDTKRFLHRTALTQQREGRVPGLAAAVSRGGELLWFAGIGTGEVGSEADARAPTTSTSSPPTPRPSPP